MTKDSDEYKRFAAEFEADRKRRKEDYVKYPWFVYKCYGFHDMTYYTDEEVQGAVKFYHLWKSGDGYERAGRQPIYIMPRERKRE